MIFSSAKPEQHRVRAHFFGFTPYPTRIISSEEKHLTIPRRPWLFMSLNQDVSLSLRNRWPSDKRVQCERGFSACACCKTGTSVSASFHCPTIRDARHRFYCASSSPEDFNISPGVV